MKNYTISKMQRIFVESKQLSNDEKTITMTFQEFKTNLYKSGKEKEACSSELQRVQSASNEKELFLVIKDNIYWCSNNFGKEKTFELLNFFSEEIRYGGSIG